MKKALNTVIVIASLLSASAFADPRHLEVNRDEPRVSGANENAGAREIVRAANENRDVVRGAALGAAGNCCSSRGMAIGAAVGAAGAMMSRGDKH